MAYGTWLGLVRIGWNLPLPAPDRLIAHGPLMACAFLGTLISLERAVALAARWGYAAPIAVAAGALTLLLGLGGPLGPWLVTGGSAGLVAIYVVVWRRQPSLFVFTMGTGALLWVGGNIRWLTGAAILRVVFWWLAFLVLTIAGERLELNRVLRQTPLVRTTFVLSAALVAVGAAMTVPWPESGVRVLGAGLIALAAWLFHNDVARRTVRQGGLTRFIAVCLLSGYVWLGVGGVLAVATGVATTGPVYDALLHAVFLGFVMSMVFGHAPVIFPAVIGTPLAYHPAFFVHVAALHLSLILRVTGDLIDVLGRWRVWGGLLNALALLLFLFNTVRSIVTSASFVRGGAGSERDSESELSLASRGGGGPDTTT